MKRHYCIEYAAKFDGMKVNYALTKKSSLKKSLSMQEVFYPCEKDTEL